MKKNTKKICVVLLLAVVAIASYFVSGTYAKYTRALGGSDTATVAKFSVTAGTLNKEQNAEIALFDTITVYWKWVYSETDDKDSKDTTLGEMETAPTVTTQVTAIFTQAD